jgi:hypothetical protein
MKTVKTFLFATLVVVMMFLTAVVITSEIAYAHCDTLNGPVVTEAVSALEEGDVTPILKWIKKEHEDEIRTVFKKALAVRAISPEARDIADRYFLETLVRLHRAGEGAPFTGLKESGALEPSVAAADRAIETGSVDLLAGKIGQAAEQAVREHFTRLMEAKKHKDESIENGRKYVRAYVQYVHFVEALHNTIAAGAAKHANETESEGAGHDH